jgi:hypothetical protein
VRSGRSLPLLGLYALCVLAAPGAALAHGVAPAKTIPIQAGPYHLLISFYDDPPRAGQALRFSVDPASGGPSGRLQVVATAVPGTSVDAVAVRGTVGAHDDVPSSLAGAAGVAGQVRLPVAGVWSLRLDIQGPLGAARAEVPLRVVGPPAMPLWLAWAVGLLPVWGLLGFVLVQAWAAWRAGGLEP